MVSLKLPTTFAATWPCENGMAVVNKINLVHLDELIKVCNSWRIPIVEDGAESLGSEYKGKPTRKHKWLC